MERDEINSPQDALRRERDAAQARADALAEKLENAAKTLERLASWRKDCHAYDADAGHDPRDFDVDDVVAMEDCARATLAQITGGKT